MLPYDPGVDVALDDDKAIQEDGAQQHEHAHSISQDNVPCHHCCAAEDADAYLMCHKNDGPVHEESAACGIAASDTHRIVHRRTLMFKRGKRISTMLPHGV